MASIKSIGICIASWFLILGSAKAQSFSFSDLFGQGKKELKNMVAQIEALNAFEASLRQGYNMLHSEWTMISNWKNGEFNLHQNYYASLSKVNPVVKSSLDLSVIQSQQLSIISQFNSITNVSGLTTDEQSYVHAVAKNTLSQCNSDMDELQKVLQNGTLQMSDDDRIKRVNQLAASIQDKYLFTCYFITQVKLLTLSRLQEADQLQTERGLYGID